jgi:hypothetical protein
MKRSLLLCTLSAALVAMPSQPLVAQTGDTQPVDAAQLLQALKQLRDINDTGVKNRRSQAYQQVAAAISSPDKAVAFWKEAVKNAQFEGAEKEGAQIRDWREGDGEALNDKLAQSAVVLHLRWLALSLQHAAGIETKQMLQQILQFTKDVQADADNAERFAEQLDKARERNESGKHGMAKKTVGEDTAVKRVHDQIMRSGIGQSPVARWLQLSDLLGDSGRRQAKANANGNGNGGGWESVPGNVDGIYNAIILPEYRATKDARLLEYWDMVLKRETEKAAEKKLDVEQRDWTQIKRPSILWGRSQDVLLLGYKNRAIGEMFNLVKTFPQHPEAQNWISHIETLLLGGLTPPAPSAPAPGLATPTPGVVPAPVAVPSAVATPPGATAPVPAATLVPTTPAATPGVRR